MIAYMLQGVGPSIVRLKEGKLRTATVQALSLASILRPVVQSGNLLPAPPYYQKEQEVAPGWDLVQISKPLK